MISPTRQIQNRKMFDFRYKYVFGERTTMSYFAENFVRNVSYEYNFLYTKVKLSEKKKKR